MNKHDLALLSCNCDKLKDITLGNDSFVRSTVLSCLMNNVSVNNLVDVHFVYIFFKKN